MSVYNTKSILYLCTYRPDIEFVDDYLRVNWLIESKSLLLSFKTFYLFINISIACELICVRESLYIRMTLTECE